VYQLWKSKKETRLTLNLFIVKLKNIWQSKDQLINQRLEKEKENMASAQELKQRQEDEF